ncbi:MAG: hypothetical protein PHC51_13690, partial [bacterium]|nr:hypothetical protein [bacterium]
MMSKIPLLLSSSLLSLGLTTGIAVAQDSCDLVERAADIVTAVHSTQFKTSVKCEPASKEKIRLHLEDAVNKIPDTQIRAEEHIYKLLGLIPERYNYKDGAIALYTSQIAGYYDPQQNFYAMAEWLPEAIQMPVTVHELTHALQDQLFDIDNIFDPSLTSDESLARSALLEGEASAVMSDYILMMQGKPTLSDGADASAFLLQNIVGMVMTSFALNSHPTILISTAMFPYISGLNFVAFHIKDNGYTTLADKFEHLPKYTAEILHPETYGKRRLKELKKIRPKDESCGPTEVHSDRTGEFFLSAFLGQHIGAENASRISRHWSNDLLQLFQCENKIKLYWQIAFDDDNAAARFVEAMTDFKTHREASSCSHSPSPTCAQQLKQIKISMKGP